jgi:hypothetical protein
MELPSCIICLEEPKQNDPLFLLACGCRVSWFHQLCEYAWLSEARVFPYSCPTCRRPIPMITNYSFSYWAGEDQHYLYHTLGIYSLYFLYFIGASFIQYRHFYILGLQEGVILTMPFVLSCWNDISYYLFHVRFHIVSTTFMYTVSFLEVPEKKEFLYTLVLIVGYFHLGILYLVHFQEIQNRPAYLIRRDPFAPYAISRELIHADSIAKPPADTREGNKSARRTMTSRAGGRTGNNRGNHRTE